MIFKINYNTSLVKSGKQDTYVSFCDSRLLGSHLSIHCFLYKFLFDKKIIDFHSNKFLYEIRNNGISTVIECFFTNGKTKLLCKLIQLMKPTSENLQDKLRGILYNSITTPREQFAQEVDRQIFDDYYVQAAYGIEPVPGHNNVARHINDNYQRTRRPIVVAPLPEEVLPVYDREFDGDAFENVHYDHPIDEPIFNE